MIPVVSGPPEIRNLWYFANHIRKYCTADDEGRIGLILSSYCFWTLVVDDR